MRVHRTSTCEQRDGGNLWAHRVESAEGTFQAEGQRWEHVRAFPHRKLWHCDCPGARSWKAALLYWEVKQWKTTGEFREGTHRCRFGTFLTFLWLCHLQLLVNSTFFNLPHLYVHVPFDLLFSHFWLFRKPFPLSALLSVLCKQLLIYLSSLYLWNRNGCNHQMNQNRIDEHHYLSLLRLL